MATSKQLAARKRNGQRESAKETKPRKRRKRLTVSGQELVARNAKALTEERNRHEMQLLRVIKPTGLPHIKVGPCAKPRKRSFA